MSLRALLTAVGAISLAAALVFHFVHPHLSGAWFAFGVLEEVEGRLEQGMTDLRELAQLDGEREGVYRQRHEEIAQLRQRLHIMAHNRPELARRLELISLAVFAGTVLLTSGLFVYRHSHFEGRLGRLQAALTELVEGRTDITVGERRRDAIGRIAAMIERTSRVMARDRQRLASLKNLSGWQEAARRHAHEMRTPLTGARLELARLEEQLAALPDEPAVAARQATQSALQELDRLARFTKHFTSFARLPEPELKPSDLRQVATEFVETFASAWSNLTLRLQPGDEDSTADVDRDMLRQVLVNLCDNASLACGDGPGEISLELTRGRRRLCLDVTDNGPGVAARIRERLFEPYATTREIGEGMGLGLAICKKIQLDHGGDLELLRSSSAGTTFRLTFPTPAQSHAAVETSHEPRSTGLVSPQGDPP